MLNYIKEIKSRLILISILGLSCAVVFYTYKEILLFLIVKAFQKSFFDVSTFNFLSTNITEIFLLYLNLVEFFSLQIIGLFILYHFFVFFAPSLYKTEYNLSKKFFFNLINVWALTLIMHNYFMIPVFWNFFYSFQVTQHCNFLDLYFEAKISEYFHFYKSIYYFCVFYMECLVIVLTISSFVINKIFVVKKYRKVYYYVFFIFSVLISPPDIFSQALIFLFILVLLEVFVFVQIYNSNNLKS